MTISPYIRRLRGMIGTELLLLPSVTVLPRDADGRILLVRRAGTAEWMTIGGMVEVDEDPADAARREAQEEAGIVVELRGILSVQGGHQFRLVYPNGDRAAYVTVVYDAVVTGGAPIADGMETDAAAWFSAEQLATITLGGFAHAQLVDLGRL